MDDEALRDLLQDFGPISIRRMFGGKGIYHQGLIFALAVRNELLFKADEITIPEFLDAGANQWTYEGRKGGDQSPCLIGACRAKLSMTRK